MGKHEVPPEVAAYFRAFNQLRERTEGACEMCGTRMVGYTYKRFCSPRCRKRAERQRRQQEPAGT